ncbi:MAG: TadE family protein [Candidatus Dormibacter sp.]
MVEFALVFPIAMTLCMGIIAGAYLFFQSSALSDGARGGARMASIETALQDASGTGGGKCASGFGESLLPMPIGSAVSLAAPQLKVNPNQLCKNTAFVGTPAHPYELTQASAGTGFANITVDVTYDTTQNPVALTAVTVTVSDQISGLSFPLASTFPMSGQSTDPVFGQ